MKACIAQEGPKAKLPAWSGPTVQGVWAIGTKDHAPPGALGDLPSSYRERLNAYLATFHRFPVTCFVISSTSEPKNIESQPVTIPCFPPLKLPFRERPSGCLP